MKNKTIFTKSRITPKVFLGLQIIMGLLYFVPGGLNGFFQFLPAPENMPAGVTAFFNFMMGTGYLFYFLKATELICGFLLIINYFAKISLIILAPITLNIFLFHLYIDPERLPMGVILLAIHLILGYRYWDSYKSLFSAK